MCDSDDRDPVAASLTDDAARDRRVEAIYVRTDERRRGVVDPVSEPVRPIVEIVVPERLDIRLYPLEKRAGHPASGLTEDSEGTQCRVIAGTTDKRPVIAASPDQSCYPADTRGVVVDALEVGIPQQARGGSGGRVRW
ncbi:MAG: hypothetical protein ABEJ35_03375 [Halobacteriaceae archaeon]